MDRQSSVSGSGNQSGSTAPGSSGPNGDYFLQEYRAISSRLKKRFLRRPNVAEASEHFREIHFNMHVHSSPVITNPDKPNSRLERILKVSFLKYINLP